MGHLAHVVAIQARTLIFAIYSYHLFKQTENEHKSNNPQTQCFALLINMVLHTRGHRAISIEPFICIMVARVICRVRYHTLCTVRVALAAYSAHDVHSISIARNTYEYTPECFTLCQSALTLVTFSTSWYSDLPVKLII